MRRQLPFVLIITRIYKNTMIICQKEVKYFKIFSSANKKIASKAEPKPVIEIISPDGKTVVITNEMLKSEKDKKPRFFKGRKSLRRSQQSIQYKRKMLIVEVAFLTDWTILVPEKDKPEFERMIKELNITERVLFKEEKQ